ncbi:MAG: imidazole glycerol phosphate synthase subunit HisF [Nitrosomonadales bacterium]|nr:imidazole glycerol phosphate synthase subunit HisF [Nitrosomonadales bacterium]|tara:strand:- start:1272 stop:2066 length:795 start_codon:yes stop_codon:yes gene_type:complete
MTNNSLQLGRNLRLIARLDIKGENLIKGIQLEGLRIIGPPNEYALKYYLQGVDELIYMDCVASLYGRNHLSDIISAATKNIFVPITVGGGIRSVDDAFNILRAGADKVAINTAAVSNPKLIENISREFGSQCMVLSVEAKKVSDNKWEVYTNNGREKTGLEVIDWVKKGIDLGAGEILLTSVDKEGTRKGFDTMLVKSVTEQSMVPLIASGGMGSPEDLLEVVNKGGASAIAMADILHYGRSNINEVRNTAKEAGFGVREYFVE